MKFNTTFQIHFFVEKCSPICLTLLAMSSYPFLRFFSSSSNGSKETDQLQLLFRFFLGFRRYLKLYTDACGQSAVDRYIHLRFTVHFERHTKSVACLCVVRPPCPRTHVGAVNGMAQSAGCFARAIGPALRPLPDPILRTCSPGMYRKKGPKGAGLSPPPCKPPD